ncbi:hypothetical protein PFISCL1PPCAC_15603, partial [Pristionchus fissidentatus]
VNKVGYEEMTDQRPTMEAPEHAVEQTFQLGSQGQELTISKIENTMASMEEQGLQNDPRYFKTAQLKAKLQDGSLPSAQAHSPVPHQTQFSTSQICQLKAQVAVYKLIARNESVPLELAATAMPPKPKPTSILPEPYDIANEMDDGGKLPYDLMKVLAIHQQRAARSTHVNVPTGIDPASVMKERENRIANRIGLRIQSLSNLPLDMPSQLRVKAEIELRALRLANFQAQMRNEVMGSLKRDTTLETALNPYAYRRTKRQSLREARITEKLEKQQKMEQEKKRRQRHTDMLSAIMQHAKLYKEFHRNNLLSMGRARKAVLTWHQNNDRERKKEEAKNEKLRMQRLMQEDEEGYRQLLDEKKDKRLVYLLEQTDEFIRSLTGLVKAHQTAEKKKKREEKKLQKTDQMQGEMHVHVREIATGKFLPPDETPGPEELEVWLESHPEYEAAPRDDVSDDSESEDEHEVRKEEEPDEFEGLTDDQKAKKILEKARNEEDEYDQKTKKQMADYYSTAHRIKEKIVMQHSTMGGGNPDLQLKPYQIRGLEWMVSLYNNNLNGILADEMGLGKTIQSVALVTYLMEVKQNNGPYLVIVPLSTISNWQLEFEKWAPNVVKIVYKGNKDQRRMMDQQVKRGQFNVLLTTYDYVIKEKALLGKIRWKYMIIDEGHRLKNHNCKLTLMLNSFFRAQHRLLLTGTPLQNKLPELWALLNFLLPSIFSSCGTFDSWFNAPFATTGEKVELSQEETMLIIRRLHKVLRPFLLRRLKKEVESQLPDKVEYVIKCDMSALQRVLYKHMQKGLLIDTRAQQGGRTLMNTVIHLRKLCNHPFLFHSVEDSCRAAWNLPDIAGDELYRVAGKFELLDKMLPKMKATGHRILIFCQMTSCMTILEDYFTYRQWKYLRLDGSTKPDERGELLKTYNSPDSEYWLFMLSTRAGGLGLNLQTADTVIIFDSDWNPHQDMQAQDRAHRIGQKKEVRVLRLITANSVEEKILAAARYKLNIDEKVIQAGKFDQRSTGAERRQMLEKIICADDEEEEDDDIPDDEAVNQLIARSEEEFNLFQSMDIDRRREEASLLHRKPRLVEENEIPPDITKASEDFAAMERAAAEDEESGMGAFKNEVSGRRKRKEVDYSADLMSDKDWLKSIDEEVDEDDADEDILRTGNGGKTPRVKKRREDEDDGTPVRKKKKPSPELMESMNKLYAAMVSYHTQEGMELCEAFIQLPPRRELPDYYQTIVNPMDFVKIKKKIGAGRYSSISEMGEDIQLLCENAKAYNMEGSDIYNNAILIEGVWKAITGDAGMKNDDKIEKDDESSRMSRLSDDP